MVSISSACNTIKLQQPDIHHFVNYCLMGGATVIPVDIDVHDPMWPGCCNPSIMWDDQDQDFKMIIRNVNYVLHGAEDPVKNWSNWGPIYYSIPAEDGRNLKTRNFIGTCKDPMKDPWDIHLIRTTPYTPIWEFQGEEDARIVRWDGRLYTTGVRRDDNKEGRGRMELMHLSDNGYQEVSKVKVGAVDEDSYCEKNWMPIKDMPFHYVQLTNPTVVVRTDPRTGRTEEVVRKEHVEGLVDERFDLLRGSSQVVRWGDYRVAIVHTCELWYTASDRKYAKYCHAFVVWDEDWNIVHMSPLFSFADYAVEFTCGLEYHDGKFYIPFAIEDNFVFLMIVDEDVVRGFIYGDKAVGFADTQLPIPAYNTINTPYYRVLMPITKEGYANDQRALYEAGMWYYNRGFCAAAYCIFTRSSELFEYTYDERFMAARCIADIGHRDNHEISMWMHTIMHDPGRPEAYMAAAMYYKYRGCLIEALYFANMAIERMDAKKRMVYYDAETIKNLYHDCLWESQYYKIAESHYDDIGNEHESDRRVL